MLWRRWKEPATGRERWQVVVPQSRRQEVLAHHHGQPGVGHFGVNKTLKRLYQAFYWVTCRREVQVYCQRCDACTAHKGPMGQGRAPLQQYRVGALKDRVAVDVLGPFPRTPRGNRFVVVAMDYFTKWPEAYAVPDQEAATVCEVLIEGMFSRFGVPTELHSDQGRNFEAQLFAEMCRQLAIHKTRTTPLRPQSDGLVERFNSHAWGSAGTGGGKRSEGLGQAAAAGFVGLSLSNTGVHWLHTCIAYVWKRASHTTSPGLRSTARFTESSSRSGICPTVMGETGSST
ncbi:hypothetical protein DPEC_G00218330 [Dallia pectoralis]|uniref:Uncharacterized protein n=1 Tax=Dallia pectoralis TaxID=75939 RepID=A0ACC2G375_DALPE|nr:hypothetical protein DPEC_G00218330 [Dallia pectoralis]